MRTVKWNPFLSGVCTVLGGMLLWAGAASADVTSTNAAAIVVFPKILVDTTNGNRVDTIIQLTNTASNPVNVRCFYANANGHCAQAPFAICDPDGDPAERPCGTNVACNPGWNKTDFAFRLTSHQPIDWTASRGLSDLPLSAGCVGDECKGFGSPNGEFNSGSIPPVSENPFRGELKCIEVGDDELPSDQNDLKGEATIETIEGPAPVDSRGYNAIGIQAVAGESSECDATGCKLTLGQQYNGCPGVLLLDSFFDDAEEPANGDPVRTKLTLVPCSEDFKFQQPTTTTVQYLVYNEFEQRLSASKSSTCFSEIALSDIDTRLGPEGDEQSIFNVAVEGTLTGQILIRGVDDGSSDHGNGLLAIAEEIHGGARSAAFVTAQRGTRTDNDVILIPAAQPTE
jgi:hypothetical protein